MVSDGSYLDPNDGIVKFHGETKIFEWMSVANRDVCNHRGYRYTHIIHIFSKDKIDRSCYAVMNEERINNEHNLFIDYTLHHGLTDSQFMSLFEFTKQLFCNNKMNGKLLIHCHQGAERSVTISLFIYVFFASNYVLSNLHTSLSEYKGQYIVETAEKVKVARGFMPTFSEKDIGCFQRFCKYFTSLYKVLNNG